MKYFRLTLSEKNGNSVRRYSIYCARNTEEEARDYFYNNFNRFNNLVMIRDVSHTKAGQKYFANSTVYR